MPDLLKFKLGRNRPIAHGPRLKLCNYLMKSLPAPPESSDYFSAASSVTSQVYLNDTEGDCVIAGMCHLDGIFDVMAGNAPTIFASTQVNSLYSAIGGYVPGDESTDNGCDEVTALNYWENNGLLNNTKKIAGYIQVNANDIEECKNAVYLFGNLYFGVGLPDAWINPFPQSPGFTWDVNGEADPNNGHCFISAAYDKNGFKINTWGMIGNLTPAALTKYAGQSEGGQLFSVLSKDTLSQASHKAPSGVDWTQLIADFDSLGGNLSRL